MRRKKVSRPVNLQIVGSSQKKRSRGGNGQADGELEVSSQDSRTFTTRLMSRYDRIPPLPSELPKGQFSESARRILIERYLLKGDNLEVAESIEERFWRTAYDIASAEFDFGASKKQVLEKAMTFYKLMIKQDFEPNSPTLMNAGKGNGLQYSACFVLPVEDSVEGIFEAVKCAALIHKTGGGTGFAFSRLRPKGSVVKTTGGIASGPVTFLRVFNAATEAVKQGGTRRGANMGILRVDHPDILEFIRCKAELDDHSLPVYEVVSPLLPTDEARSYFKTLLLDRQIANFNISVAVTDKFMETYYKGGSFDLIDPRTKEVVGKLFAREVLREIIERAWHTGDPGLVFIDRINNSPANPVPGLEEIEATNPCGEQPLAAWDACNLGSINLGSFVKEDGSSVDWGRLKEVVHLSVEFLDNVVQVNPYTLLPIWDEVHRNRRIGLGVMGWADLLFKLKIPYNSEEALQMGERMMKFINEEGHQASEELAKIRGPFPNWSYSIYKDGKSLRNSTITTIAPTGTISIIADCSSGIEPVFALSYLHRAKTRGNEVRTLTIANQTFEKISQREGFYSDHLAQKVLEKGTVLGHPDVPEDWQKVFVTAPEIDPSWHVKMQAAFQKYTDNGVSKTINLPNHATVDDVAKAYLLAWETGCKGITIYRDGSKAAQVLNISATLKENEGIVQSSLMGNQLEGGQESQDEVVAQRPVILRGRTYKVSTPVGKAFITINRDDKNQLFEVFVTIGKTGMHTAADAEAIGRLASLALRASRGRAEEIAAKIVTQLRGIGGSSAIGFGKERVMSLADAVAKALAEDLALLQNDEMSGDKAGLIPLNLTIGNNFNHHPSPLIDLCPECGQATLVFEEGCQKCHSCGYSKC